MIRRLIIRDLALMDRADLEVGPGFTVVTGETGAGKSVLLGALSLLAGNRAAKTIVRKGAEECAVEAELEVEGDRRFDETLKALDLPACDDGLLILKRSVHATKAGRISVNGGSATLTQLQQLGELWIDFHGPGEPQKLMRAETQLEMLDLHAGLAAALTTYRAGWRLRNELLREAADGESVRCDERTLPRTHDAGLQTAAPVIAPREERVARGRTHARGRMRICETHPGLRQPIHVRRGDFSARGIVALHIAVAEIVGQNNDDVRFGAGGARRGVRRECGGRGKRGGRQREEP